MAHPEKINPLVSLIEHADTEEYRAEVAASTTIYYEEKLGINHPGVMELRGIAIMSLFRKGQDSHEHAQEAWTEKRKALGFWKRIRTPHEVPEEFVQEWAQNERIRALMDVSQIMTERQSEL